MSLQDQKIEERKLMLRREVLLSSLCGLTFEVSPALRAMKIGWDETCIHCFFYYDGEISEEDHHSAECVTTNLISHFSDHQLKEDILCWDEPKPIPFDKEGVNEEIVYFRRELCKTRSIFPERSYKDEDMQLPLGSRISLSALYALRGEVGPALRAVTCFWMDALIQLFFYYDGEVSKEDRESATTISARMVVDFPDYQLKTHILRLDCPQRIPLALERQVPETIVYHRRE